jgi:predicted esterase
MKIAALILALLLIQEKKNGDSVQFAGELKEASQLGLTLDGATVKEVAAKSIADKSGLKAGDVLKKVEGKDVSKWEDVLDVCGDHSFSCELKLEVERAGKPQKITLKISGAKVASSNGRGGKAGKGKSSMKVGDKDREYSYRAGPNAAKGAPSPLFIMVHGDTWTSDEMADTTPPEAMAQGIVVCPNGINKSWGDASDGAFILGLVDEMKKLYNVDLRRITIAGHSSGGMLSLKIVQEHGDLFAAAAFFGVKYNAPEKESKKKCPILIMHGTTDTIVPPAEGKKAADELKGKGWTVTFEEQKGAAHAWVPDIAKKAWDFVKMQSIK